MQEKIPLKYSGILSRTILNVADRLGFRMVGVFNSGGDSISIRVEYASAYKLYFGDITISGRYSEESGNCSVIKCFNDNEFENDEKIFLTTQIGYRNYFWNGNLFPKLLNLELENSPLALSKNYKDCTYIRKVRLNQRQTNLYTVVKKYPAESFKFCLEDIITSGIYNREISRSECIAKLQALGGEDKAGIVEKLKRYRIKNFNWLEYFSVSTPPLNLENLFKQEPAEIKKFEEYLALHMKNILLLDFIWQNENFNSGGVEDVKKNAD